MIQGVEENRIWLLFTSGESSRVNLSLHHGKGDRGRPADAYVVTGGGLSKSARRAAEAVFNWLQQAGRNPDQFVAGFDVQGADNSMAGESGGLSFAIALAARLLNREGLSVAATGEITGGQYPGPLTAVDGINEKLSAAAVLMPPGSFLFFPATNEGQVTADVWTTLHKGGIHTHSVASVAEALEVLFNNTSLQLDRIEQSHQTPPRTGFIVIGMITLCVIVLSAGVLFHLLGKANEGSNDVKATAAAPVEDVKYIPGPEVIEPVSTNQGNEIRRINDQGFD